MAEGFIGVLQMDPIEEHEDGSVTYDIEFNVETRDSLVEYGTQFILHCAAYGWDIQDALDSLKREAPEDV